jgi:hypothetical protein
MATHSSSVNRVVFAGYHAATRLSIALIGDSLQSTACAPAKSADWT